MRTPLKALSQEDLHWDCCSLALTALFLFFQALQWPLLPKFVDAYYHLAVMKGFCEAGGYVTHAFWEYAPVGRPHLYPPLFHILMLVLYRLGLSAIAVSRLLDILLYPAVLWSFWYVTRRFWGSGVAFFAVLIYSSSYFLYVESQALPAFTLAFGMGLFAILFFHEGRWFSSGLFIGLCFYTHTGAAVIVALSVLAMSLGSSRRAVTALRAIGTGVLSALPLLSHQFLNRRFFQFVVNTENSSLSIDVFIYVLGLWGLVRALAKRQNALILAGLAVGMLPMLATHPYRLIQAYGLVPWVWGAAIALHGWCGRGASDGRIGARLGRVLILLAFFYFLSPVWHWDLRAGEMEFLPFQRTISRFLMPDLCKPGLDKNISLYFKRDYDPIVAVVRSATKPQDILWSNLDPAGELVAVLSDRHTSTALMREVKASGEFDPVAVSKLVIWFKDPKRLYQGPMARMVRRYRLNPVGETQIACLFENPEPLSYPVPGVKPMIPEPWFVAIFLSALLLVVASSLRDLKPTASHFG